MRKFTPTTMNEVDMLKLFDQGRLDPNVHENYIKAQLAFKEVSDPASYEHYKKLYEERGVQLTPVVVEEEKIVSDDLPTVEDFAELSAKEQKALLELLGLESGKNEELRVGIYSTYYNN